MNFSAMPLSSAHSPIVLDIYSGVGSFGLECISRGAKKVTFVERDNVAIKILKQNLSKLSINEQAKLCSERIENFLIKKNIEKYSIFFLDPPFADQDFIQNLTLIKKNKIFESNHIVIIHREKKVIDNIDHCLNKLFTKSYGRSKIIFGTLT